jgi:hypothetical protein
MRTFAAGGFTGKQINGHFDGLKITIKLYHFDIQVLADF